MYQAVDSVIYGNDLADYLHRKFRNPSSSLGSVSTAPRSLLGRSVQSYGSARIIDPTQHDHQVRAIASGAKIVNVLIEFQDAGRA